MRLTSPATQYLSILLAVLATVAALALWNRVRGPRVIRVLARLGLLCAGYAATVVAVLVSVNIAYGGLIVSVDDLFADLNPPMAHHRTGLPHRHRAAARPQATPAGAQARHSPSRSTVSLSSAESGTAVTSVVRSKNPS